MSDFSTGMHSTSNPEQQKFEDEVRRVLDACDSAGLTVRVTGSMAFQLHCSRYAHLRRVYSDIDFAAYAKERQAVSSLLASLGYAENMEVTITSAGTRMIFDHPATGLHLDVFYDKQDFCHEISWKNGRLEADAPTLPLAEMLLGKMQIVEINEKDITDTIMLLLEHPLGESDDETLNISLVAELCAGDWGLWRTTTMNLSKVRQMVVEHYDQLSEAEKAHVIAQVETALQRIDQEPKPLAWRLRDRVGDRVKWYKDVDEV